MATLAVSTNTLTKINKANKKIYEIVSSKINSSTNQKHGIVYGIIDIEKFSNELLSYFRIALEKKVLASKYVKFHILPHKKRKSDKATMFIEHIVPTLWVYHFYNPFIGYDSFFDQVRDHIYRHGYSKKIEHTRILARQKLLKSNAKKCLSFSIHVNDLIAIDEYVRSIFKDRISSAKTEIYIEFDIDSKKMSINKEFEVKILKIETCEESKRRSGLLSYQPE